MRSWMTTAVTAILFFHSVSARAADVHVMIDAGHGGHDQGAVRKSIIESNIVLNISDMLVKKLRQKRIKATPTRTDQSFLGLGERGRKAIESGADLFVSIHANSSMDERARGGEIYFQSQLDIEDESKYLAHQESEAGEEAGGRHIPNPTLESLGLQGLTKTIAGDLLRTQRFFLSSELAKSVARNWNGSERKQKNSLKQGPFFLVNQLPIPSILVEVGYITHPEEGQQLTQKAYQQQIADRIFNGIQDFLKAYGHLLKNPSQTAP